MAPRKVEGLTLLNNETGEEYGAFIVSRRRQAGGKWMKVWQEGKVGFLARNPGLSKEGFRVLYYMEGVCDWQNVLPPVLTLAKQFKLAEKATYRAYAELIKAEFVIKQGGVYYLNPLYCWKGTDSQYRGACERLLGAQVGEKQLGPGGGEMKDRESVRQRPSQ